MSARPDDLIPDLAKIRTEFEAQKRRAEQAGDSETIAWLTELERKADDPSFWENPPSVLDQLADHLKRLGLE